jgi:hypothetical protein
VVQILSFQLAQRVARRLEVIRQLLAIVSQTGRFSLSPP